MSTKATTAWAEQNQRVLVHEFASLRSRLGDTDEENTSVARHEVMEEPSTMDALATIFELSAFERDLLMLCGGVEMDSALAERCGELIGKPQRGYVTFALAMTKLREPHWSALAPTAPLRRYRLIEMESGHGFTSVPLHIDERILHYLAGVNELDKRLEAVLHPKAAPEWMAEDHFRLATETIASVEGEIAPAPVLHLFGDDPAGQECVAALLARRAGRDLYVLRMEDTPATGADMEQFLALWIREAQLLPAFLLLQWESDMVTPAAKQLAERLARSEVGPLIIASREPLQLHCTLQSHEVNKAGPMQQRQMWEVALGPAAETLSPIVDEVAQQFRLSAEMIVTLGTSVVALEGGSNDTISTRLWSACRSVSRPRLESLAERIVPMSRWEDLVLPEMQMLALRQLAAQSRNRMRVYEEWGFSKHGRRGLGLSALFSGPSGTGKTLAAEVLAADLRLDMYRIDLSAVVSKYIGETEKNLKQVFDAAENGGVLLLFDEADAIFGKRAEVKDSHDRYANIEVGYLLQRMESFQGIAVLTTNVKSSLDKAFQRRLRFLIDFPFPDAAHRAAIWTRAFPSSTPMEGIDPGRLASLNMSGGSIRNIAVNAAFLAADEGTSVQMSHLLRATQLEGMKTERPITPAEIRGWV